MQAMCNLASQHLLPETGIYAERKKLAYGTAWQHVNITSAFMHLCIKLK